MRKKAGTSIPGGSFHYNINKTDVQGVAKLLATVDNSAQPEKTSAIVATRRDITNPCVEHYLNSRYKVLPLKYLKDFRPVFRCTHTTSSPRYPASNGKAEQAVRTIKEMLKKCDDPYLAMLIYRSTTLHNYIMDLVQQSY